MSSRAASALADRYDYIYAAVGSHPDAADEVNDVTLEEYRTLCKLNPKIKAIGEIGLDYHYEDIPRERQQAGVPRPDGAGTGTESARHCP